MANEKMKTETSKPATIDEYIARYPDNIQEGLELIRTTIKSVAPLAEEKISYAIPTFKLNNSYLIHFAAFKNHIGLYPLPAGDEVFKTEIAIYKSGKSTVQFPLAQPMPLKLLTKMVKFRLDEISERNKVKVNIKNVTV